MSVVMAHSDDAARRIIREAIDETVIVEAAAGTGKTTELVNRILAVLREGRAEVREIVAVTFTEKAAGELKLRLRQGLELERRKAHDPAVIRRLEHAVARLEEAHVSTIHGFCADLLRERPVEAGVDPLFKVLTEGQAERLFGEAFDSWFQSQLENPPEGVRRSLRRPSRASRPGDDDEDGPVERLRRAAYDLAQWGDFRAEWTREPLDRGAAIADVIALVHRLADISAKPSYVGDNLYVDTEPVRRASRDLKEIESRIPDPDARDLDLLESRLIELHRNRDFKRRRKGSGPTYGTTTTRAQVLEARDALVMALTTFQLQADAELAALLHGELFACVDRYEALKQREGALDFLDLLVRARNLVRDDIAVRTDFQRRFRRIFVDEFQDTDPLQAELLMLLASADPREDRWEHAAPEAGKLFIVGDPKQSIYRFRRADVDVYRRVCRLVEASGARSVQLRTSFRSVPNIQRAVNAAFAPIMASPPSRSVGTSDGEEAHAGYVPLEAWRADTQQPSVVALPVPRPYGRYSVSAMEIEKSLPSAVGAYVEWLVNRSGWTVTERRNPDARVPLEPRHICLLFRRFVSYGEDITRKYVEALEARGVRHLLVGGKTFHDREEIETMRAALTAIEWPDDQLSVFATLRGALFAIGDEELLDYHHLARSFHPFRIPEALPPRLEPLREALQQLALLHRRRNGRPAADTVSALLDHTRAHVGFVLRPGGEQALANVLHVAELARQYESEGGMSFRGFVETLQARSAAAQAAEAPILEEGSDGVRLMTVHKAKGLEFPVVILADITARLTPYDASRHVDAQRRLCALRIGGWSPKDLNDCKELELQREQREGERIAYVAATRARDLLVVPAVGDEPYPDGWVAPLNAAVYPRENARRQSTPAEGCPVFKSKDTVLERPEGDPATSLTVCPGEHHIHTEDDSYSVVWWSPEPGVLNLEADAPLGLRRDDLIVKDVAPETRARYQRDYIAWRNTREEAVTRAKAPSIHVMTATEAALGELPPEVQQIDIRVEDVSAQSQGGAVAPKRSEGGTRFGTLVHALLADLPLDQSENGVIDRLASVHGRVLGATSEEIVSATAIARRVQAHSIFAEATRAQENGRRCYREIPVTLRLDSGELLEGIVDLAFEVDDGMVVVDFKTDRELQRSLEVYRRQVQIYAHAMATATGLPARGLLMKI
jgi:ATP-dependent exoDNAse (exonuclease V) beta subunit